MSLLYIYIKRTAPVYYPMVGEVHEKTRKRRLYWLVKVGVAWLAVCAAILQPQNKTTIVLFKIEQNDVY